MKTKLAMALGCILFCIVMMAALYVTSSLRSGIYRASFIRMFTIAKPIKLYELDLKVNSYYVAGITKNRIYLANYTSPFYLLSLNHTLSDPKHIKLQVVLDSMKSPSAFRTIVDSPYFYMVHGEMGEYLRGRIGAWIASRYLESTIDYSVESVPISPSTLILRSICRDTKTYKLGRKTRTEKLYFNDDLLKKQIDGLFCLEGMLLYEKETNKTVYLHQYRNEIIVADTNLNLIHRTHTIDTFSRALVKVATISNESMLSAPPKTINVNASLKNNILYVKSNILSAREEISKFSSATVIDAYDVETNTYINSFYVQKNEGHRPTSFKAFDNNLLVLTGHHVMIYQIPKDITDYLKSKV